MPRSHEDPILTVKLEKGLADRQRLSLAHVIGVLDQIRNMIAEVGRDLQRQNGVPQPSGDFGLELIAGASGAVVRKGSITAHIALTQNTQAGLEATRQVVKTIELLDREELAGVDPRDQIDARIVKGLIRIARIQRLDKTEMRIALKGFGQRKPIVARFGESGMAAVRSLQASTFTVEDVTVYGKLIELADRDPDEDDGEKGFWGVLRRENGDCWRLQCAPADKDRVAPLFMRQVRANGTAMYYRVASTKLIVKEIEPEIDKDFDSAFDELFGSDRKLYNADFDTLMRRMRGDE
ncbi:MAG: hypothetical protein ABSH32_21340 [Bryobacteraceae bacterium]|jgi:hypothetical protein